MPSKKTAAKKTAKSSEVVREKSESPQLPITPGGDDSPAEAPKPDVKKKAAPKKAKKVVDTFQRMVSESFGGPLDVFFQNETTLSKEIKGGFHRQMIRVDASQQFNFDRSIFPSEGEYAGLQLLVFAPAKPFPFQKLPAEVRNTIYRMNLAPCGNQGGRIILNPAKDGRIISKTYMEEAKYRLAISYLNKQTREESRPILYSFTFRFDTNGTLLNFLSAAGESVRSCMVKVEILNYQKPTAMAAMSMLAECKGLQEVLVHGGIGTLCAPDKAAKAFSSEASRLLAVKDIYRPTGLEVFRFGSKNFSIKEGSETRKWTDDEIDRFTELITSKSM